MSEISSDLIHHGFWINWSSGRVLGATLTTESTAGNSIIACIAILVALATDHLWNLMLFVLHQSRAKQTHGNAIFQQEQAIFRSLPTPFLLIVDIAKIVWAWRKSKLSRPLLRMLLIGLVTLAFGAAALVTSIFSSFIVRVSNVHVLVSDTQCAIDINWDTALDAGWATQIIRTSQAYADGCYESNTEPSGCNVFVQPRVALSHTNVTCPFNRTDLCISTSPVAVVLDSGLVDSDQVLGVNAGPENRIFFRKRTTYTPIRVEGQYTVLNRSQVEGFARRRQPILGEQVYSFNYGQTEHTAVLPGANSTAYLTVYLSQLLQSYTAWSDVSYPNRPTATSYNTTADLYSPTADTALVFIYSNNIQSAVAIDDPVFSAHTPLYCDEATRHNCSSEPSPDRPHIMYSSDYPAGVIAAHSQYQACLSDKSGKPVQCSDLTSVMVDRIPDLMPAANEAQKIVLGLLGSLTYLYDLDFIQFASNDASVIKASHSNMGGYQLGLPSDQWVAEAIRWESTIWAALQTSIANHASGWGGKPSGYISPTTDAQRDFCKSQKVLKPGGFANINVLGLSLCISISLLIIFIDVYVLKFVIYTKRCRHFGPRLRRWIQDGVLQLQRRAYEAEGFEPWDKLEEEVPILYEEKDLPTLLATSNRTSSDATVTALHDTWTIHEHEKSLNNEPTQTSSKIWSSTFSIPRLQKPSFFFSNKVRDTSGSETPGIAQDGLSTVDRSYSDASTDLTYKSDFHNTI